MDLLQTSIRSQFLGNDRRVWIQLPETRRPQVLCVLLDGEYYVDRMHAPAIISELHRSSNCPPFAVAYVSYVDGATRWRETACNALFASFVVDELLPCLQSQVEPNGTAMPTILGGLSLTGLAAAYVALLHPERFAGVLCQSASFWWSESWIVDEYRGRNTIPGRFRISCGSLETTDYVEHGPGMIQTTSQLACNRAMRDLVLEKGCDVSFEEFNGGHDIASWSSDLPRSLLSLLDHLHRTKLASGSRIAFDVQDN